MCIFGGFPKHFVDHPGPVGWRHPAVPSLEDIDFGIIGWRTWRYSNVSDDVLFGSFGGRWYPDKSMGLPAGCNKLTKRGNEGVYANKQEGNYPIHGPWGEVLLWGRVAEYDMGYRSEYAYPLSFFVASLTSAKTLKSWRDRGVIVNYYKGDHPEADAKGFVEWV